MLEDKYFVKSSHFSKNSIKLDSSLIGQKAIGLFDIPSDLTPPFIVLTSTLFESWLESPSETNSLLELIVDKCIELFSTKNIESFIIRSSAEDESFEERGFYNSSGSIEKHNLYKSIIKTWEDNKDLSLDNKRGFSLIIQQYIKPKLFGHLSNERRVSRYPRQWSYEIENLNNRNRVKEFTINEEIKSFPVYQCKNQNLLKKSLVSTASYWQVWKYHPTNRYHLEWVWDQNRLWIVQNDVQDNSDRGAVPGSEWGTHLTDITQEHDLTCFSTVSTTRSNWKKINCVKTFADCSLPYGNVYILEDDLLLIQLSNGNVPEKLVSDLNWLLQTPIVIRMDIASSDNVLLPRTETLFTIDKAIEFLCSYSKEFLSKKHNTRFCFLIHRFIVSKSCALAFSRPNISKVRIDSTWGIVDGLHYHTHDSFEVEYKKSLQKKIRCKTEYIDVESNGNWYSKNSGTDWDWADSLTKYQIDEITRYNLTITEYLNKPVTVMYFVDVNPATGYTSIIPWFYSTEEVLDTSELHFKDNVFSSEKILVQDENTFSLLKKKIQSEPNNRLTIKLKLSVDIVRDKSLVEEIGLFANQNNLSIELEGSILAHTYYILKKQNARVKTTEQFSQKTEKQVFNKLVRDKIPENITAKGEKVKVQTIPNDLKLIFLKRKAIEEAYELFWEKRSDKDLEEIADLYEVIRSICKELNVTLEKIAEIADIKNEQKGSFDRGLFLFGTENPSLFQQETLINNYSLFEQDFYQNPNRLLKRRNENAQGIFFIPYVPDIDMTSAKLTRFFANQDIEIFYTEDGIKVRFLNHDKDPNQLSLF